MRLMREYLEKVGTTNNLDEAEYTNIFVNCMLNVTLAVGPILVIAIAVGIIAVMAQTNKYINFKDIRPKFAKLNPITGFKNLIANAFSPKGWVKQLKELLKVCVIVWVLYNAISGELRTLPDLLDIPFQATVQYIADLIMEIIKDVCIAYAVIVAFDYGWEKYQYEKSLRMSKEEIKEENKQMEGDPQIKSKIRQKQKQMGMQRLIEALKKADVIIRNPTHYAVALQYDKDTMDAPVVVAKGVDFLALRIVELGLKNDVYCMENKPLARALYDSVEIGFQIPPDFYQAVADVLACVYNLKNKTTP
jgi:flagellar biosynthetic protein FlhB